jgi:uncharacterized protein YcfJ
VSHPVQTFEEHKMEINQATNRLHPLVAGAAVSVMLVSLAGAAAIIGVLPNSHGSATPDPVAQPAVTSSIPAATATAPVVVSAQTQVAEVPKAAAAPVPQKRTVHVVHHYARPASQSSVQYAQAPATVNQPYQQPVQQIAAQPVSMPQQAVQQPVAQHSPLGIAAGAVLGGVLGNQVGGGNGRTLATVAGAVGGGYLGDVIGKKYGY